MPTTAERVAIPGPMGNLEAVIETPRAHRSAVAVICHPHPLHGGTMNNKVVTTLGRCFVRSGAAAIRFNFRGVEGSDGAHDAGEGEIQDVAAAVAFARARWPDADVHLGGFSFGAAIAVQAARAARAVGLVTIAPPVSRLQKRIDHPDCPWLLIQGTDDDVVPAQSVQDWAAKIVPPPEVRLIAGAGHFFHGRLADLTSAASEFIERVLAARDLAS